MSVRTAAASAAKKVRELAEETNALADSADRAAAAAGRLAGETGSWGGAGGGQWVTTQSTGPDGGADFGGQYQRRRGSVAPRTDTRGAAPPGARPRTLTPSPTPLYGQGPGTLLNQQGPPVILPSVPTGSLDPTTVAANQAAVQTAAGVEALVAEIRGLRADQRGGAAQNDLQLRALGVG